MQRDYDAQYPHEALPPEIYRRRRIAVLVAVLVTVGLVAWAISGGGSGSTASTEQSGPHPQPVTGAGPSHSQSPRSAPTPTPTPTVTVTVTATPTVTVTKTKEPTYAGKPCRKVGARLAVHTDKKTYATKAKPVFKVRLVPKKRCWVDPDKLQLLVTSGTDHIWSSTDCKGRDQRPRRIGPKHPYTNTMTWQRVRSNPAKCGQKTAAARPGWYVITVTLPGDRSAEAVFRLT